MQVQQRLYHKVNGCRIQTAVFLVNWARLAASDPDGEAGADAALNAINEYAGTHRVSPMAWWLMFPPFLVLIISPWDDNPM